MNARKYLQCVKNIINQSQILNLGKLSLKKGKENIFSIQQIYIKGNFLKRI